MIERKIAPPIKNIDSFEIPLPDKTVLENGIELYTINMGSTDVMRIDMIFSSGKWEQKKNLLATFTNLMLKEGTHGHTSQAIAESLDFHGAWLQCSVTQHNSYVTLYILNKHIAALLPLLYDIIVNPTFPEKELLVMLERHKQQFRIDNEKVDHLCLKASLEQLYGKEHPYGKSATISDFDNITVAELKEYHAAFYNSENCKIMLTGKVTEENAQRIVNTFGQYRWGATPANTPLIKHKQETGEKKVFVAKKNAVQSAIRIATPTISREQADYHGLRFLNTVFGGYFGSRLMNSIREEKGYTYGIGSSISTQQKGSTLTIATQTGSEYVELLIDAVFDEMHKLQTELIPENELECVRNYLLGDITRSFDGPFAIADAHLSLMANQLSIDYFRKQIEVTQQINATTLQELAQRYLIKENFFLTIAGNK